MENTTKGGGGAPQVDVSGAESVAGAGAMAAARGKLGEHREAWRDNAPLRALYRNYYRKVAEWLPEGARRVLEVGGGIGNLKEGVPHAWTSDLVFNPWVDMALDAQRLPFRDGALDALVLIDVLHHLEGPLEFFEGAARALRPGGRLILVDVYVSPLSWVVLKLAHPEPVDFSEDFWARRVSRGMGKDPWEANQAMVTQFFWREPERFAERFPELRLLRRERFDWCWPLSGGFSHRPFWPAAWAEALPAMSGWAWLNALSAFRSLVVLERAPLG